MAVRKRLVLALAALLLAGATPPAPSDTAPAPLPDPLAARWKGSPVCEVLSEDEHLRALRCSFAPGQGHERHFHARHFGYALSGGRMRIVDARGTREVDLETGTSFASAGVEWHEVLNVGTTTVVYLIVEPR
jgi:quercetin dioxygenase-like cupin family protein